MPRILLTGFFGIPGPTRAGVQMRLVMRALSRHHEVDVLAVREPEQAHMERVGTARILRVPLAEEGLRPRVEAFRRALRRQLEAADYDVVHFRDGWSGSVVLELRGQHGYQTVFDATRAPLAEPPMMDLSLSAELGRCEEACLAQADHVLVPSALARDHVLKRRSKGVHIVPAGVDVDLFDWDDLPPGPPTLLYAGSVEAGRGLRGLLRAMATVVQRSEATLVIAGRTAPAAARSLLDAAAELGLRSNRLDLRGEVAHESMPELIAQATVCVAPSAVELIAQPMAMVPTKILEFMACRRAVVAPRRGTVATVIEHDVSGLLFQPGDPADLAHKLLSLLHDPDARERLAGTGYHLVREYYTASAMRRALRRAYAAMQIRDTRPHHALTEVSGEIGSAASPPASRATASTAAESSEAERTDQIPVPFPGLPPAGPGGASGEPRVAGNAGALAETGESGDATDIELTQLPRGDSERLATHDTVPDLGHLAALVLPPKKGEASPKGAGSPSGATAPSGTTAPDEAPDDGPVADGEAAAGRRISSWETFEMPVLQAPRPAPAAPRPAPAVPQPAPAVPQPAPAVSQPAPAVSRPAPTAPRPAPPAPRPAPAAPRPAPAAPRKRAAAPGQNDRDYRTVSGEVEVRAPAPPKGEIAPEEEESFKAVSVLLGGSKDESE